MIGPASPKGGQPDAPHACQPSPQHATVVAYLALFVALGGTSAYAINEWNSSNIQNETLLSEDIKNGEIGSADVKDNSINTFDANALHGSDIIDGSLTGADIEDFSVGGRDIDFNNIDRLHIVDGNLNDEDITQSTVVNFQADIAGVAAHSCVNREVQGVNAPRDHLLLTPNFNTTSSFLTYGVEYTDASGSAWIKVCNPTNNVVNDGLTRFNLLVIDAQ